MKWRAEDQIQIDGFRLKAIQDTAFKTKVQAIIQEGKRNAAAAGSLWKPENLVLWSITRRSSAFWEKETFWLESIAAASHQGTTVGNLINS